MPPIDVFTARFHDVCTLERTAVSCWTICRLKAISRVCVCAVNIGCLHVYKGVLEVKEDITTLLYIDRTHISVADLDIMIVL